MYYSLPDEAVLHEGLVGKVLSDVLLVEEGALQLRSVVAVVVLLVRNLLRLEGHLVGQGTGAVDRNLEKRE